MLPCMMASRMCTRRSMDSNDTGAATPQRSTAVCYDSASSSCNNSADEDARAVHDSCASIAAASRCPSNTSCSITSSRSRLRAQKRRTARKGRR
jgi:hypothetical protein